VKIDDSYLARRRFLGCMLGGGVTAMAAGTVVPLIEYTGDFHPTPPPDFLVVEKADYELPPGKAKMVLYGHIPALLLQPLETGSPLKVFVATCTHLNCTVSYQEAENRIHCACHDGNYDTEGRVVSGPPPRPLQQFFTKFSNEKLIIALEKDKLEKAS
jgi:Rieske Fe-S protein